MVQFGDSTNYFVNYTATLNSGNLTAQEKQRIAQELMESVKQFAIDISTVGAVAIVLTYIGNTLLSYTASRQVCCYWYPFETYFRCLFFRRTPSEDYSFRVCSTRTSVGTT